MAVTIYREIRAESPTLYRNNIREFSGRHRDALLQRKIRSSYFVLRSPRFWGNKKKPIVSGNQENSVGDRQAGDSAPNREMRITCVAIGIRNHPRERIADPMVLIVRRRQASGAVEEHEEFTVTVTNYRIPLSRDPSPSREIELPYRTVWEYRKVLLQSLSWSTPFQRKDVLFVESRIVVPPDVSFASSETPDTECSKTKRHKRFDSNTFHPLNKNFIDDLVETAILGYSFLFQHRACLDVHCGCLYIGAEHRITIFFSTVSATTKHSIHLKDYTPFRQVEQMLADGIIEPTTSNYASPIVIVKNKDGRSRFCVDYRRLNAVTKDEAAPLPIIQETLRDLGQSKQYTAFSTPDDGLYQFCVMPFELKGVPSTFQRLICQEVLPSHLRKFTMVYLDHIVGYFESYEEHLRRLRLVFERLQTHGLCCSPQKCRSRTTRRQGTGDHSEVSSDWLRDYMPNFAHPLTDLLSQKRPYRGGVPEQESFDSVKRALSALLMLHRPDSNKTFVLQAR
ncbi:hypothetical protein GEV33_010064 [Tenebrio molitor]|uniref:Reverse transcriptase domain-containing protein n=1 Tax=Tenebrio molitor TaxID=7067 RepID=A0A8J6HE51_TENMO|nr:hypothetical protein GEV33_010064 [Tenebrio molitor]